MTASAAGAGKSPSMLMIIAASAAGTSFEWYDFFVFGALTPVIAKNFFASLGPTAGLLAALALFGTAYLFRPLGALIFGRVGDRIGRKGAFVITVTMMGAATFAIGLLPTWVQVGPIAPALLITLRIIQGTALGGQYGGAAIYVAEHAPANRRGFFTSWVQASAAFGLIGALAVIAAVRATMPEARFSAPGWDAGWRIPFLLSVGLLAISIWMRLRLTESPAFARLREAGEQSKAPYAEAFGKWANLKVVLTAFVTIMSAQGAAWYLFFFYAVQVFLQRFLKLDPDAGTRLLLAMTVASAPFYVVFGWLSDRIGRKWVIWFGMTLALVSFFPGFHALTHLANPALEQAQRTTPVVVVADPARCSVQFDILGRAKFATSCDIAKSALADAGVSYANQAAPAGAVAVARIGAVSVVSREAGALEPSGGQGGAGRHRPADREGAERRRLSRAGGSGAGQLLGPVRHPDDLRDRRDRALWSAGGMPGRALSDPGALHRPFPALPPGHRLGRRLRAGDRAGDRGRHRRHLFGPLVPRPLHRPQRGDPAVPAAGNFPPVPGSVAAVTSGGR